MAAIQSGRVSDITVTDAGRGYSSNTLVEIGPSSYPDVTDIQLYVGMRVVGQVGSAIELQVAPALDDPYPWFHLTTVTQTVNPSFFLDRVASDRRFYRALPIPTNPVPTQLAWIPPGTFTMGSPTNEPGRRIDESEHIVSITDGFWMGRHEVTQDEFMHIMLATPSMFTGEPNRPVENVSWQEAVNYCETFSRREQDASRLPAGYVYRLPTEAEWEYGVRAGSSTPYFFGDDPEDLGQYAWYSTNSDSVTHPPSSRAANQAGLSDVYGNVAEWCLDWYGAYAMERTLDPHGPTNGTMRTVRGGNWQSPAVDCRSASRGSLSPSDKNSGVGFRTVLARGTLAAPTNPNPSRLVWIPSGTFLMGSLPGELDRGADETLHPVTISRGFWIGKLEVTVGEYTTVTGIQIQGATNWPVGSVTWNQANEHCKILTQLEQQAGRVPQGYVYRLPTEAEWEYAARSGTRTRFHFGDDLTYSQLGSYAWVRGGFGPGGQKLPSPSGVYDLYGNVAEWCADWYGPYPGFAVVDPRGVGTGTGRVFRGGAFDFSIAICRSAARASALATTAATDIGFRVVLAAP